ncbi:MAG TPA: hypothetical protein VHD89_02790 [Rhodanobacteraceae bacterium]|nr:hypothetical protein [Rhodanobacteraceae bacterium]
MDDLRTLTAAHAGGTFAPLVRILTKFASACWNSLHAALHESREREAARVIARYRHLSTDAEEFYQREIVAKRVNATVKAEARMPAPARRRYYIDPMQSLR